MNIKKKLNRYLDFSALDNALLSQYRNTFETAFPDIILKSEVVNHCWDKVEKYFPNFQRILVGADSNLIGFINTIPVQWNRSLEELPEDGWDWLMQKGISDYENGIKPNCLGGLQIVVSKNNLGQGFSKLLIAEGKRIQIDMGFQNFILPIRPIFKKKHPRVEMKEYMNLKKENKIYDPWIRTHLNNGAEIIKVCSNAMNVKGDLKFWKKLIGKKITYSGSYEVEGALNLVSIDVEKNHGEYKEENIWVNYKASHFFYLD